MLIAISLTYSNNYEILCNIDDELSSLILLIDKFEISYNKNSNNLINVNKNNKIKYPYKFNN